MDKDNSLLRAKFRRVEEDNNKKEKEIESLMDPTKVSVKPHIHVIFHHLFILASTSPFH